MRPRVERRQRIAPDQANARRAGSTGKEEEEKGRGSVREGGGRRDGMLRTSPVVVRAGIEDVALVEREEGNH